MALFSYVDLHQEVDSARGLIITRIVAKAVPRIYTQIEPQGLYSPQGSSGTNFQTQSQRSFGLAGIMSFNNRNALGNGESLKISSITSYEAIFKRGDLGNFQYALQQGFNMTLSLPNFTILEKFNLRNPYQRKNTVFSLSYQSENNPNFKRSSLPDSVSLQFIRPNFSWYYTPIELSFNRNEIDPSFLPRLPQLDQDFVKRVCLRTNSSLLPNWVRFTPTTATNQGKHISSAGWDSRPPATGTVWPDTCLKTITTQTVPTSFWA